MTAQISDSFHYHDKEYHIGAISDPQETLFDPREFGLQMLGLSTACYRGYYLDYALDVNKRLIVRNLHGSPISDFTPTGKRFRELIKEHYHIYKQYVALYFELGKTRNSNSGSEELKQQLNEFVQKLQQLDEELKPYAEKIDTRPDDPIQVLNAGYLTYSPNAELAPKVCGIKPQHNGIECHYYDINHPVSFTGSLIVCNDFINEMYEHMGFQDPIKYREVRRLDFIDGLLVKEADRSEQAAQERQAARGRDNKRDLFSFIQDSFSLDFDKKWFDE